MISAFQLLEKFYKASFEDGRIGPTHISLYLALLHQRNRQNRKNPFTVTRAPVMKMARISSRHTYYKYLRDLHSFGYIKYSPSFHPLEGGSVFIYARKRKR
jgi:hypothetical protein